MGGLKTKQPVYLGYDPSKNQKMSDGFRRYYQKGITDGIFVMFDTLENGKTVFGGRLQADDAV
jgi:hypothetical protein